MCVWQSVMHIDCASAGIFAVYPGHSQERKTVWYPLFGHVQPSPEENWGSGIIRVCLKMVCIIAVSK